MEATLSDEYPALRLLPRPSENFPSTSVDAPWRRGHLAAVGDYLDGRFGQPAETAILALADGLQAYVDGPIDWASDALASDAMIDVLGAFGTFLNYDLGRLDAGVLSSWASELTARVGGGDE
ncbi:MAG TPA: hypothetical protein VHS03_11680 [Gaiellaceae bacterium]|jgi:hypothetical protein|nr:hypothetical protein [Gaiellaceae bacterium]